MLSREDNELLTRVGAGTPTGELFRRYWMPLLLTEELTEAKGCCTVQNGFQIPMAHPLSCRVAALESEHA